MTDLLPLLKPLKGNYGGYKSLIDYQICRDAEGKLILRFSIAIANIGVEDLHVILGDQQELEGRTVASAKQIIKQDDGTHREVDVGLFERHKGLDDLGHVHYHWHYRNLASLDLVDKNGVIVASSKKDGYCVIDSFRYPNFPERREKQFIHEGCERKTEKGLGITAGWCDYYKHDTEKQYIEIENVPPGEYTIRFSINKTDMIYEIDKSISEIVSIEEKDKETLKKCSESI
jgi:Lysyl oxidase